MTLLWILSTAHATPDTDTAAVESKMTAEEAEIFRLREEMSRFQESGALQYSERVYKQMLEIDTKQQWMTDGDHLGGAMASNSRGDLAETLERLERCRSSERAVKWRSFLWSETGPVKIESRSASELTIMMGLLTPDQIAALDYANQQLKQQRVFVGRLPNGAYQYGSSQFIVSAAGITMTNTSLDSGNTVASQTVEGVVKEPFKESIKEVKFSGGLGAATGVFLLGEGIMLETDQTLESRTMLSLDIRPHVTISHPWGFASLELGARNAQHKTTNALVFIPSATIGKEFDKFRVGVRTSLDVARLTFQEADYIKRSVGYTFGLRGNYCPLDSVCVDGQVEAGILGSHSVFGTSLGMVYRL